MKKRADGAEVYGRQEWWEKHPWWFCWVLAAAISWQFLETHGWVPAIPTHGPFPLAQAKERTP